MLGLPKVWFDVEKGFAPIFMLLLLVAGVGIGTYLVQNRTNIMPFAADTGSGRTISTSGPFNPDTNYTVFKDAASCMANKTIQYCNSRVGGEFVEDGPFWSATACGRQVVNIRPCQQGDKFLEDFNSGTESKPTLSIYPESCTIPSGQTKCLIKANWTIPDSWTAPNNVVRITVFPTAANVANTAVFGPEDYDPNTINNEFELKEGVYKVQMHNKNNPSLDVVMKNVTVNKSGDPPPQSTGSKSPPENFDNLTESQCKSTGGKTWCFDDGQLKNEYPSWNGTKCVPAYNVTGACKATDKYKNGENFSTTNPPEGAKPKSLTVKIYSMVRSEDAKYSYKDESIESYLKSEAGVICEDNNLRGLKKDGTMSREILATCGLDALCGKGANNHGKPEYGCFPENGKDEQGKDVKRDESVDENALFEKCGFTKSANGVPMFAMALGKNAVGDPDCQELLAKQSKYFQQAIDKAKEEAEEAAKREGLIYENGEFKAPEGATEEQKAKATELNSGIGASIKKAEEEKGKCDEKDGEEKANCLKGAAQGAVQGAATEAQKAASKAQLAKFEKIISGDLGDKEEMCVKADLGVAPFMDAEGIGSKHVGEEYRLLVCRSKADVARGKIKWRVLLLDSDNEDPNNTSKAERLRKLHPTGTGDPVFEPPVAINTCVKLSSNDPEAVKTILAPYINAATSGTGKAEGCERIHNPNDTGGNGSSIGPMINGTRQPTGGSGTGSSGTGSTGTGTSDGSTAPSSGSTAPRGPKVEGECSTDDICLKKNGPNSGAKCDLSTKKCYIPRK